MRATWIALCLCACYSAPSDVSTTSEHRVPIPEQEAQPTPAPQIVCDMAKFSFGKEGGCANDGWVEFCADKAGAPVLNALRSLAPNVAIYEGQIGRAGCSMTTEYLVSQPITESDCLVKHGALTDAAWNTLCALSQLPETRRFVPGFAE